MSGSDRSGWMHFHWREGIADCEVLLNVKIPATVTSIAENAFNGSTKARIDIAQ